VDIASIARVAIIAPDPPKRRALFVDTLACRCARPRVSTTPVTPSTAANTSVSGP